jgi:hypothetical protein
MSFDFEWNPLADQPHNVAPRSERFRHHLRHAGSYFEIVGANLRHLVPGLRRYRRTMKRLFREPVAIPPGAFGCGVSPAPALGSVPGLAPAAPGSVPGSDDASVLDLFTETGASRALVRVASWERESGVLAAREGFIRALRARGVDVVLTLLQRRADVLDPGSWRAFLEEVFGRFAPLASAFEIGHAWNRTKWGVWDHREYLRLAEPAFELAPRFGAKLAGPAVIDFEFHLYPVTLPRLPFDAVTSLLYVDRMGAPENGQFGWTATMKLALLKAAIETTARPGAGRSLWITEVNWPLAGTGAFSPASGKPNVSEDEQADFLVRYYVLCLASGLAERVYWWQLVAPGYGLLDNRESPWRRRPAFRAFAALRARLEGSVFEGCGRGPDDPARDSAGRGDTARGDAPGAPGVEVFRFRKDGRAFAICWAPGGGPAELALSVPVAAVLDREGRELPPASAAPQKIVIDGSPKYVLFKE